MELKSAVPGFHPKGSQSMQSKAFIIWGVVLGVALGGFFDGILLHQILQWHHLLSLVPQVSDLRMQVLWDGWFHALMYVLALAGLWGLWHTRHAVAGQRAGRRLLAALLVGIGLWHVADSLLSHWLLGIHRIRVDSPNPLLWDLIWFAAFGLVPLALGWLLLRGSDGSPDSESGRRRPGFAMLALAAVTTGAAVGSLQPPPDQRFTTVVFRSDADAAQVFAALAASDARMVWADDAMGVVVVDVDPARRWDFYRRGAWLVSGAGTAAACISWSRAGV